MYALPQDVPNESLPIGVAANVAACTLLLKRTLVILQPAAILGHPAGELNPPTCCDVSSYHVQLSVLLLLTLSGSLLSPRAI